MFSAQNGWCLCRVFQHFWQPWKEICEFSSFPIDFSCAKCHHLVSCSVLLQEIRKIRLISIFHPFISTAQKWATSLNILTIQYIADCQFWGAKLFISEKFVCAVVNNKLSAPWNPYLCWRQPFSGNAECSTEKMLKCQVGTLHHPFSLFLWKISFCISTAALVDPIASIAQITKFEVPLRWIFFWAHLAQSGSQLDQRICFILPMGTASCMIKEDIFLTANCNIWKAWSSSSFPGVNPSLLQS